MSTRRVATVEDADEYGNPVEGTQCYASSVAPSSPAKEQPNTSRARKERTRKGSDSHELTGAVTDSDSTVHPRRESTKKPSKDREKSSSSSSKKALMTSSSRPPVKHSKATSTSSLPRRDEAMFYGIADPNDSLPMRPRSQSRPASFYPPPGMPGMSVKPPPPANARFYASQPPGGIPTSYPPPPWAPGHPPCPPIPPSPSPILSHPLGPPPPGPPPLGPPPPSGPPLPPPEPPLFARPLESRFGPSARPQSSIGFRPAPSPIEYNPHDDYYDEPHDRALARRPSASRRMSKVEDDRKAMALPRRAASARPMSLAIRGPPPAPPAPVPPPVPQTPASRRIGGYDDHDDDYEEPFFRDLSPRNYDNPLAPLPRSSYSPDYSYDAPDYQTEVPGRAHRHSYYGGNSVSSGSAYERELRMEDKLLTARRYQDRYEDELTGPGLPLTAEALRKATRNGGSSRSTRSSGSHDESDYRQSATTRTTRSGPNDENYTIRVKGSTVLRLGGAEVQCEDGAEINISTGGGASDLRNMNDARSSYIDLDDRRTRVDIPPSRSRTRSRARSFSRPAHPRQDTFEYDDEEYEYLSGPPPPLPPPPPSYPAFSSSYSSRHDSAYYYGGSPS